MGILENKVAIVTGAGKGLGVSEAIALAKEGAAVTVCARTYSDVVETAKTIENLGGQALAMKCDVCVQDEIDEVVAKTVEKFGAINILVNNAQISFPPHGLESWTNDEMTAAWESGPLASWRFMQRCFPHMQKAGGGRIINLCSPAGHGAIKGYTGYSMAKEAVRSLTRCAAREWGIHNITVNSLSPMAMSAAGEAIFDTQEKREALFEQLGLALPRFGDAESDVGRSIVFLAGPDGKYITGCTLGVDGGAAML